MVDRDCPVCGSPYQADPMRLRHGRQTTCSRECSYAFRAKQLERRKMIVCAVCEVELTRCVSQIKSKHGATYCSPRCMYLGRTLGLTPRVVTDPYVVTAVRDPDATRRSVATRRERDNYRHSDDTRARLSEATARAIAEGRIKPVSQLEDEVARHLDTLGVGYVRQHPIRGAHGRYVACADFLLEDGRVLEVNGTFWHADPRVYPDGPTLPAQIRTAERWGRKIEALSALGVTVIVVWEQDVRDSGSQAVASSVCPV